MLLKLKTIQIIFVHFAAIPQNITQYISNLVLSDGQPDSSIHHTPLTSLRGRVYKNTQLI